MTKKASIFIYPWDLQDEGIPEVLERLKDNNINGLNVTVAYHSGRFFLPHNPNRKLYFPEPGALYFPPDEKWYGKIKIKPPVSRWASKSFWNKLREETFKRDMELNAWAVALHNSSLGFKYPEVNNVDAFGNDHPTSLSPANNDIRSYLTAVFGDLARNYNFDNILIESLENMPLAHDYHHEVFGIRLSPAVNFLMSLSFDSSFCEKAKNEGIEVERVREYIQDVCRKEFEDPYANRQELGWEELYNLADGELGRFLDFRVKVLTSLVKAVHDAIRAENTDVKISAIDLGPLMPLGAYKTTWQNGMDLSKWAQFIDEIHPTFYMDKEILKDKADEYVGILSKLDKTVPFIPAIRTIHPQVTSKEDLTYRLSVLKTYSRGYSFYNYGFMPYKTLEWIREALKV